MDEAANDLTRVLERDLLLPAIEHNRSLMCGSVPVLGQKAWPLFRIGGHDDHPATRACDEYPSSGLEHAADHLTDALRESVMTRIDVNAQLEHLSSSFDDVAVAEVET
jgi:hypothetical protein